MHTNRNIYQANYRQKNIFKHIMHRICRNFNPKSHKQKTYQKVKFMIIEQEMGLILHNADGVYCNPRKFSKAFVHLNKNSEEVQYHQFMDIINEKSIDTEMSPILDLTTKCLIHY